MTWTFVLLVVQYPWSLNSFGVKAILGRKVVGEKFSSLQEVHAQSVILQHVAQKFAGPSFSDHPGVKIVAGQTIQF